MADIVSYNLIFLPISLILTIVPFLWLRRAESGVLYYFLPLLIFLYAYCGAGMGWEGTPLEYVYIYGIYMFILGQTSRKILLGYHINSNQQFYEASFFHPFVVKRSSLIITMYISTSLIALASNGKLLNIFSPPGLSLTDAIDFTKSGISGSAITIIMYYIQNLILPFYLLALYKYKYNIVKLSFCLLFPLYLQFCSSGYIARSGVLPFLIIIYVAFYMKNPKLRKKIVIWTAMGMPALLIGLSYFTFMRIGKDFDISAGDAIKLLCFEETGYPMLFDYIWNAKFDNALCEKYLKWLVGLPFPGFIKGNDDFFFNAIFTERVTGMDRSSIGFSVLLPGLVGESVFYFGRIFFVFHAFLVAFIYSNAYRIFCHKQELFLLMYCAIFGGLCFCRGGTTSMLPFYFKHLIIYVFFIYFLKHLRK